MEQHFHLLEMSGIGELMAETREVLSGMRNAHESYVDTLKLAMAEVKQAMEAASSHSNCASTLQVARDSYNTVTTTLEGPLKTKLVDLGAAMRQFRTKLRELLVDRKLLRRVTSFHAHQATLHSGDRNGCGAVELPCAPGHARQRGPRR